MKRRRLVRLLALLAVLAALTVWLEPTRVVWGWLRGEAFYQGRPTSYWAERIRPWEISDDLRINVNAAICEMTASRMEARLAKLQGREAPLTRQQSALYLSVPPHEGDLRKLVKPWLRLPEIPWPAVLDGDPDAEPVLTELLTHDAPGVRDWARRGLERIQSGESGPVLRVDGLALVSE
jgi:hypothetical protein